MIILPDTLLKDLESVSGFRRSDFLLAHSQPPPTSVRIHPHKDTGRWNDLEQVPWCTTGRYLPERPVFTLDPAFHAGAYYVQEASSMFLDYAVRSLLNFLPDAPRVLDLCGAPGGKSTLLAAALPEASLLISNEVIRTRAGILEENVVRWGYTNNWVTSNDAKDFRSLEGYFDLIVVDAPCSGSGLFRKDPKALEEWSESNVDLCSQRQQRILADVWPALKENGFLIYATCSYSEQENEQILDWLTHSFHLTPVPFNLSDNWGVLEAHSRSGLPGYRFFPDRLKGEGFFIAVLQKKKATGGMKLPRQSLKSDQKLQQQTQGFLKQKDRAFLQHNDVFLTLDPEHLTDFHLLSRHLYLRKAGLPLGNPSAKEWLPSHELALSIDRSPDIPTLHATREQALKFLKKEDPGFAPVDRGWFLVSYEEQALGWVKSLGNRFNNYLPRHWRIRMALPGEDWA